MVSIIQNDIGTLLRLYNGSHEQEDKIIETVLENYVRSRLGYGYVNWNERQKENILRQFKYVMDRQEQLRNDIHRFYINKIEVAPDLDIKCAITAEYTRFVQMIWLKSPNWLETLEMNLPHIEDISPTDRMLPIFNRVLSRMKTNYQCGSLLY